LIPQNATPAEILAYRHAQWLVLEGMEIIQWTINPPAKPEEIEWAITSSKRIREYPAIIELYLAMNGCTIIWNYDHAGIRHEGHLQIFPIQAVAETNFVEEFGYDEDDIPGMKRLAKCAYILSQNDSDTCIDFRKTPPEILFFVQRGDIERINLPLEQWLRTTLLTVGDKEFWPVYVWAGGGVRVKDLGIEGGGSVVWGFVILKFCV
jgi:hypothetical protein